MFILAVFLLSIYWCLVPMLHTVGQFHYYALVDFLLSEYFLVLLFFVLICVR
jgi:apolipoprotein N-acyltransferase